MVLGSNFYIFLIPGEAFDESKLLSGYRVNNTKKQKIEMAKEGKSARITYSKPKAKSGGTTNIEKLKNK